MFWDPVRTVPPAALPVSLAEFKAQVRYFQSDEDAIMMAHLRSAVEMVENRTYLGLITQVWQQSFSVFPMGATTPRLVLQRRPVQEVLDVSYLDATSGMPLSLDPLGYTVSGLGNDHRPASLRGVSSVPWPSLYDTDDAVTVTYRVGYGDDHNSVPEMIRQAILLAAGAFFAFREDVVMATTITELPFASKVLLSDWRPLAVA